MGKCISCCKKPAMTPTDFYGSATQPQCPEPCLFISVAKDDKTVQSNNDACGINYNAGNSIATKMEKSCTPPTYIRMAFKKQVINVDDNKPSSFVEEPKNDARNCDISVEKITALFDRYRDKGTEVLFEDGIVRFCSDLGVQPDDFIVLVIAWKCMAEKMGCLTRREFVTGCKAMGVDSVIGLQSCFSELKAEVNSENNFRHLYRWTYKFCLDGDSGQRTLPLDMAVALWKLVFSQNCPPVLQRWLDFLEKHNFRGIPKDTWDMFLNFTEQIGDNLSLYDDNEAWPSILDDFVEFENDRQNQNVKVD